MSPPPIRVLLIEDTPADAKVLREALAEETPKTPFHLTHADRLATGLEILDQGGTDLVLLDLQLPDSKGLDTVVRVRERAPRVPIIVLTSSDDDALAVLALQKGAEDYLVKGYVQVYPGLLGRSIRYAIERKRAEEEIGSAHAQTAQILSSITSILIGVSPDGLVTHWNAIAEATFGFSAASRLNRPLADCEIPWDLARVLEGVEACRASGKLTQVDDLTFQQLGGQSGCLGLTITLLAGKAGEHPGVLLFGADITARKQAETDRLRLQEQLIQAQKVETIGRFAGGIAHDFNNFLQVILGFAWLIRARHREDQALLKDIQEVVRAAENASGMVRQLLAFARRQPLQPQLLEINQTVQSMDRFLQQFVGDRIRVEFQLSDAPLTVQLDPTGLQQIIMNLCSNARDSMGQGGTLTLTTAPVRLDAEFVKAHSWAKAGEYVRLSIRDTGTGMEPGVSAHIFEPFFTTKPLGRGTGLGLAVVYGLVKQHDGLVDIETAPGDGTTFHLYFLCQPAIAGALGDFRWRAPEPPPRREVVLVVDDDRRRRALTEDVLREAGYQVESAADASEAIERLARGGDSVEALIVDVSTPEVGGRALLERLCAIRPAMKALVVSGYIDQELRTLESSLTGVQILQTPYVPAQLLERLRQLFDESPRFAQAPPEAAASAKATRRRVLVVDDDASILHWCERILESSYHVTAVSSGRIALDRLRQEAYDVLLTDLLMPELDGFALLDEVARIKPHLKAVVMTGSLTPEREERLRASAFACQIIRKPFTPVILQDALASCF